MKSTRGKGILGTIVAFSSADEEQGRKTFYPYWQLWVIEKTLQNCLFHEDITIRDRARKTFLQTGQQCYNYKLWSRVMHHTQLSK